MGAKKQTGDHADTMFTRFSYCLNVSPVVSNFGAIALLSAKCERMDVGARTLA